MKDIFNNNFENESNDNSDIKSLENFFSKNINIVFTPQEMMVVSLSLSHVASVLNVYNKMTNIAVFDVDNFIKENPDYINTDFNNLDKDTTDEIRKILEGKDKKFEEFNKGDILIKSIINVAINLGMKLCDAYTKEYDEMAPKDTMQFFTVLENFLNSTVTIVQTLFAQNL